MPLLINRQGATYASKLVSTVSINEVGNFMCNTRIPQQFGDSGCNLLGRYVPFRNAFFSTSHLTFTDDIAADC